MDLLLRPSNGGTRTPDNSDVAIPVVVDLLLRRASRVAVGKDDYMVAIPVVVDLLLRHVKEILESILEIESQSLL